MEEKGDTQGQGGAGLQPAREGCRTILSIASALVTPLVSRTGQGNHNLGQRIEGRTGLGWEALLGIKEKIWAVAELDT